MNPSRRRRWAAWLGLGLGLCCGGLRAQSAAVETLALRSAQGVELPAVFARPSGPGPFPAVVMLHGCAGLYSDSMPERGYASLYVDWGARLLAAGYAVLATDSFTSRGAAQNQCGNGSTGVSEVAERPLDAQAAYAYLAGRADIQASRVGLLGWSHGGSTVLATLADARAERQFAVAVAYYPGCGLYNAYGGISGSTWRPYAPTLIVHGDADPLYLSGYCARRVERAHALGAALASGNAVEMAVYAGAQHSFDDAGAHNSLGAGRFTQADLDAKAAADPLTLWVLDYFLKPQVP